MEGQDVIEEAYWYGSILFSQVKYLIEIKIYNISGKLISRYEDIRKVIDDEHIEMSRKYLVLKIAGSTVRYIGLGFVLFLLAKSVVGGEASVGQAVFYLSTIFMFVKASQSLFTNLARARQEILQIAAVFEFLDTPVVFSNKGVQLARLDKAPRIAFEGVHFGYHVGKITLSNISFVIEPGEKVAIVGLNGAGKTTLIKLLCRVYDPQNGVVTVNGKPLSDIDPVSWYQNLSVVFQEYGRYEFTVSESVGVTAKGEIDIDRVRTVTEMAEISGKIEGFDKGYYAQLGTKFPGGEELSVGQWQKLAIARALYRQSKVIILDEPTSSVDAEAEEEIFNRLHELSGDTTLIFVSHRFSTIRQADKIIFVANGGIDCVGSHEYLIQHSREYKRLYDLQSQGYK